MNKRRFILIAEAITLTACYTSIAFASSSPGFNKKSVRNLVTTEKPKYICNIKYKDELTSPQFVSPLPEFINSSSSTASTTSKVSHTQKAIPKFIKYNPFSMDLRTQSHITSKQLNSAIVNTKLANYSNDFVGAANEYHINEVFLTSIAALESGWGTSSLASNKNNLFGFGGYRTFSTKKECIYTVAKFLSEKYLTNTGSNFHGYTLKDVNQNYCTKSNWYLQVGGIMNSIQNKVY